MTRKTRIVFGMIIFSISILLLIWAYKPLERETRIQPIAPFELQLPTPISFLSQPELVT